MLVTVPPRPDLPLLAVLLYMLFAFGLGLVLTPWFIEFLRKHRLGKQLRVEAMDGRDASIFRQYHQSKQGTPTMGGLLIWGGVLATVGFSRLLSFSGAVEHSLLQRGQVYLPLFALVSLGLLGALDDYLNICGVGKKRGMETMPKILSLLLIALLCAYWFYDRLEYSSVFVPLVGSVDIGWLYVPLVVFIIVGTANAVNFTDGLDGLAGGLLVIAFGAFGVLAYLEGLTLLAAFCAVCVGSIAAFLWHNVPPALFFMGDTGSLALGGTLGVIALMTDHVLELAFIGFIFVVEALSVIIQLTSKRLRGGKKVFRSAPIHHHFEALGWGESKVTMRFWIIGAFAAFFGIILGLVS